MYHKSTNKVRIEFTNKKMTAYGGFSLLAAFFEKINLRGILQEAIPIRERSPNGMGIYSKVLAYILLLYARYSRFSHLLYLGWQGVFSDLFAVRRLPLASTTLTRLFKRIRKLKEVEVMSEGLWGYLSRLIPWNEQRTGSRLIQRFLSDMAHRRGQRGDITRRRRGVGATARFWHFSTGANM